MSTLSLAFVSAADRDDCTEGQESRQIWSGAVDSTSCGCACEPKQRRFGGPMLNGLLPPSSRSPLASARWLEGRENRIDALC